MSSFVCEIVVTPMSAFHPGMRLWTFLFKLKP
nr:MAG TPA: hypothetical protein [Bacteriophage sp.]